MTEKRGPAVPTLFLSIWWFSRLPVSPDRHLGDRSVNREVGDETGQQRRTENDAYQKIDDQEESCTHQHPVTLLVTCLHDSLPSASAGLHTPADLPS